MKLFRIWFENRKVGEIVGSAKRTCKTAAWCKRSFIEWVINFYSSILKGLSGTSCLLNNCRAIIHILKPVLTPIRGLEPPTEGAIYRGGCCCNPKASASSHKGARTSNRGGYLPWRNFKNLLWGPVWEVCSFPTRSCACTSQFLLSYPIFYCLPCACKFHTPQSGLRQ